ncbi:MAG: O-antigen ligase domain-containing protein [Candidatus Electrothrix sp. AR1]|nr:O-antigen ligase domain-containing protein [Candidatus Electrothrix sp. AR1]
MNSELKFQKAAQYAVLFLLGTIPFLFGAVHPIVIGVYTSFIILILGGWLLLNSRHFLNSRLISAGHILFFLFILWIILSIIPIPMSWLSLLSPARASFLQAANQLAGTDIHYASPGYNSTSVIITASFLIALYFYALSLTILLKADRSFLEKLLLTCIGVGILEAVYGLLQATNSHLGVLWLSDIRQFKGMARGTIIYKNQYAALLNMIWPLAVGVALLRFKAVPQKKSASLKKNNSKRRRTKKRSATDSIVNRRLRGFLLLFFASIIMLAVLFSQSRGGIISMVFILLILLTVLPVSAKNKFLLSGFFVLFSISYGSIIGFTSVFNRFMLIHQGGESRFNIWLSSLPMLRDHLLVGTGIDSYTLLSSIYLKQFPENVTFDRAHNDYLEFAIELGLPLALFFFCTLSVFLFLQIKKIWSYTKKKLYKLPSPTVISLVSITAIIGFIIHGTVDFGWRLPANLLYFATLFILLQHGAHFSLHVTKNKS